MLEQCLLSPNSLFEAKIYLQLFIYLQDSSKTVDSGGKSMSLKIKFDDIMILTSWITRNYLQTTTLKYMWLASCEHSNLTFWANYFPTVVNVHTIYIYNNSIFTIFSSQSFKSFSVSYFCDLKLKHKVQG